ncbi:MAG: flavodoxin [Lachnospiraceae bacterium]|nr:flavodoxin [Lachnospiraceae bacterium]
MAKVSIVFWSGTGNTASMAQMVADGVKEAGAEAELIPVGQADIGVLKASNAFALGCPSMGAEQLEESEMEPFMEELDSAISGKQIGLFGSYGWGNQEWMRDWEDRIRNGGASVVNDEGVTILGAPTADTEAQLKDLGRALARMA